MRTFILLATALLATLVANAQSCPKEDPHGFPKASNPSVLHGTLLLHDELRRWLGIKLERPACGQTEVELVFSNVEGRRKAETLQGCNLDVNGKLYFSPSGYYSAAVVIWDPTLKPDPACHPHPLEPDLSSVHIPTTVAAYHASITVDYRGKGHIGIKVWQGDDKSALLAPWQAYVTYRLNGALDVIYFDCQNDFQIKDVTQTPQNPNGLSGIDPTGTALQDVNGTNVFKFSCQRKSESEQLKR
jgi:hypothetical protein